MCNAFYMDPSPLPGTVACIALQPIVSIYSGTTSVSAILSMILATCRRCYSPICM